MAKDLQELGEQNPFVRLTPEQMDEFARALDKIKQQTLISSVMLMILGLLNHRGRDGAAVSRAGSVRCYR